MINLGEMSLMETAYRFIGDLGLAGIFLGTIIESLGIPFPGGIMLILAGVLISGGELNFFVAFIIALAGYNLGSTAAYLLGKRIGEPVFEKMGALLKFDRGKLEGARSWMEHSAVAFIILGRFLPMAGNFTPYLAGVSGIGTIRFLFLNNLFAMAWSSFNIALGYYFSKSWQIIKNTAEGGLPYLAGAAIIIYLAAMVFIRKRMKEKNM
ncbi:MAG: DedA family protein [Bacillota bacterium]